jgi:Protein of unknown function (DUF1631)
MQPTEPRLQSALEAAMNQVKVTAAAVTERVTEVLGAMARSTTRPGERDQMLTAQQDLQRNIADFHRVFKEVLRERMEEELAPRKSTKRALAATDWQSLSLVEDEEVDEKLHADRIAQMILHECEVELRELSGYMSALVRSRPGTAEGNPLRADVLGTALYRAIEAVSDASEVRRLLARDLGQTLARAMPACYAEILNDLKSRGVKPVAMTVRSVEGPGTDQVHRHQTRQRLAGGVHAHARPNRLGRLHEMSEVAVHASNRIGGANRVRATNRCAAACRCGGHAFVFGRRTGENRQAPEQIHDLRVGLGHRCRKSGVDAATAGAAE